MCGEMSDSARETPLSTITPPKVGLDIRKSAVVMPPELRCRFVCWNDVHRMDSVLIQFLQNRLYTVP